MGGEVPPLLPRVPRCGVVGSQRLGRSFVVAGVLGVGRGGKMVPRGGPQVPRLSLSQRIGGGSLLGIPMAITPLAEGNVRMLRIRFGVRMRIVVTRQGGVDRRVISGVRVSGRRGISVLTVIIGRTI